MNCFVTEASLKFVAGVTGAPCSSVGEPVAAAHDRLAVLHDEHRGARNDADIGAHQRVEPGFRAAPAGPVIHMDERTSPVT